MPRPRRKADAVSSHESLFPGKRRKAPPYEFLLEALAPLAPWTRPMFGCLAVYVKEKIMLILRDKHDGTQDNGVWLCTTSEHHDSLRRDFPSMRSIRVLGKKVTGWQVLPADAPDFEGAALRACDLIIARDPRIGKVPGAKGATKPTKPTPSARKDPRPSARPKTKRPAREN